MTKLTDVSESVEVWEAKSASGRTTIVSTIDSRGRLTVRVTRDGHDAGSIQLGYETNMGPHTSIQTDGTNLYLLQEGQKEPEVVAIV